MISIDNKILKTKPREESGSKTSRKYQFQKDLSLFILLGEHSKREDYIFLFDFHEDLVISSSSTTLTDIDCFQIKSKDTPGNWTIKALTKRQKGKNSILGKLYYNKIIFEGSIKSLNFISNGKYGFERLKDGSDSTLMSIIRASQLSKNDLQACNDCILNEHSISPNDFVDLGQFRVTTLSNAESSIHCVGALVALIHSINPSNKINAQLAYEQVSREINRKTNTTVGDKSFANILEIFFLKGISKKQFLDFLQQAGLYKSVEEEWNEVKSTLESEGVNYKILLNYKNAWREMSARLIADANSIPLRDLKNKIDTTIIAESSNIADLKLNKIIDHIYNALGECEYGEYFVKCLIIVRLNES